MFARLRHQTINSPHNPSDMADAQLFREWRGLSNRTKTMDILVVNHGDRSRVIRFMLLDMTVAFFCTW